MHGLRAAKRRDGTTHARQPRLDALWYAEGAKDHSLHLRREGAAHVVEMVVGRDRADEAHLMPFCVRGDAGGVPAGINHKTLAGGGIADQVDVILHLCRSAKGELLNLRAWFQGDVAAGQQLAEPHAALGRLRRQLLGPSDVAVGRRQLLASFIGRGGVGVAFECKKGLALAVVRLMPVWLHANTRVRRLQ